MHLMLHRNCHLIPKLRANITSSIWTSSLIPSNILVAPSMEKTFKYISLKTLVHRDCHLITKTTLRGYMPFQHTDVNIGVKSHSDVN